MGFLKKKAEDAVSGATDLTGKVVGGLTGATAAANQVRDAADIQAAAVRQSAADAAKQAQEAAAQTARMQEQTAARSAAQGAAADALAVPLENADVQIGPNPIESVSATARKRRQTFGIGSASAGVSI
jgi:hypothetical protein